MKKITLYRLSDVYLESEIPSEYYMINSIEKDRTYFASIESGKRNVSIINIHKIAPGLEIKLCQLPEGIE